jgi:peroxiredoxin Q/BCP
MLRFDTSREIINRLIHLLFAALIAGTHAMFGLVIYSGRVAIGGTNHQSRRRRFQVCCNWRTDHSTQGTAWKKRGFVFLSEGQYARCTTEGQDFRDLFSKFKRQNTLIFGISRDSIAAHEKFRDKQQFPFELLSDPDEKLCRQFDVIKEKMLYGRKFMGIERSTFLIDAKGKLRQEWRKVKVKGHAAEVLAAVKNC